MREGTRHRGGDPAFRSGRDATTVKEPGKTGALWRIHYSVCLPAGVRLLQAHRTEGPGTGESLAQFPRDGACAGRRG